MIGFMRVGFGAPPPTRLDAQRVYLRPGRRGDWRHWIRLREQSRDFLTPWEPTWPPDALSRSLFLRRLARQADDWRRDQGYAFLIFRRSDDVLVGGIGLTNIRRGVAQSATVGYWLGQGFTGQGFMTEALSCVVSFAFRQLNLHRIEASCLPNNESSKAVLMRVGFSEEGYARGFLRINGQWCDHLQFAVLRGDFGCQPVGVTPQRAWRRNRL